LLEKVSESLLLSNTALSDLADLSSPFLNKPPENDYFNQSGKPYLATLALAALMYPCTWPKEVIKAYSGGILTVDIEKPGVCSKIMLDDINSYRKTECGKLCLQFYKEYRLSVTPFL